MQNVWEKQETLGLMFTHIFSRRLKFASQSLSAVLLKCGLIRYPPSQIATPAQGWEVHATAWYGHDVCACLWDISLLNQWLDLPFVSLVGSFSIPLFSNSHYLRTTFCAWALEKVSIFSGRLHNRYAYICCIRLWTWIKSSPQYSPAQSWHILLNKHIRVPKRRQE